MKKLTVFIIVLFLPTDRGYGRNSDEFDLVSDGLNHVKQSAYPLLNNLKTSTITCEPKYGFLPCAPNLWGYLFLVVVYQYLLFLGGSYVSRGSQLMFRILGPGIFGASAFQILGSLTNSIIVLASGVSTSREAAQAQVASGVAMLAGSTVFLLTLLWGTCVVVGKVDISVDLKLLDTEVSKPWSFLGSGVTTDLETQYTSRIMISSTIPFMIAQLPHVLGSSSGGSVANLIALIVSLTIWFSYCLYQVFQPWIQNRRHEYMMRTFVENYLLQKLLTSDQRPNVPVIVELFRKIDKNNDKYITPLELKGLILGIQFQEIGLDKEDFVEAVLKEFDVPVDAHIDEKEFVRGISKWLSNTKESNDKSTRLKCSLHINSAQETEEEQNLLITHENKNVQVVDNPFRTGLKAASLLLLGTTMLLALGSPLTESVINFSNYANIPSVYVSFIVVPMVTNYGTTVSTINSIKQKSKISASLTLSEIYTTVFMNNITGVSSFLVILYARDLEWGLSAEVAVVVVICLAAGLLTSFYKTFPLWTCFIAYLLYLFSVALLSYLSYTVGEI